MTGEPRSIGLWEAELERSLGRVYLDRRKISLQVELTASAVVIFLSLEACKQEHQGMLAEGTSAQARRRL